MSNRLGVGLFPKCYNNRGLINHHFSGAKNLVVQDNGTLYAAISVSDQSSRLLRSTDGGFSWTSSAELWDTSGANTDTTRATNGLHVEGPINSIMLFPDFDRIIVLKGVRTADPYYEIHWAYCTSSADITDLDSWSLADPTFLDQNEVKLGVFSTCATNRWGYIVYVNASDQLTVRELDPQGTVGEPESATNETSQTYIPVMDCVAESDSSIHILCVADNGSSVDELNYVSYNTASGFGTPVVIDTAPGTSAELVGVALAQDGYGTLCAVWGEVNDAGTTIDWRVAISTNNGTTWTKTDVPKVSGNSGFEDDIANEYDIRTDVVGGRTGGFMITYTMDNSSNVPKSYIRYLATANGVTYTLSSQTDLDMYSASTVEAGLKFFKPVVGGQFLEFEDLGLIRAAIQLGEGDSVVQNDETPVYLDQFLLREGPFASDLDTESGSYTIDTPDSLSLYVNVEITAGPSSNRDFYADGMVGYHTNRFMSAFDRVGVTCRVLKYEPQQTSLMGDRSGYTDPTEYAVKTVWDPQSYSFPTPDLSTSDQDDYIEKDVRKIFFPPNFHPSRVFVRNQGNFLKRTVWTAWYDGNEYEISQVIPHFLDDQICYYEVNAYVIGPSRDPFTRTILPSET